MSDYISKSALIEELEKVHPRVNGVDVFWMTIRGIEEQPTLDEKEIIRKTFERVVDRLEEYRKNHKALEDYELFNGTYCEIKQQEMAVKSFEKAIVIVKEECGINE
jgi:hypothetical protein